MRRASVLRLEETNSVPKRTTISEDTVVLILFLSLCYTARRAIDTVVRQP